jgi:undecaprenyl-diphosphatase
MLASIIETTQQFIQTLDEQLLLLVNGSPAWAADGMWWASQTAVWIPLYIALMLWIVRACLRIAAGTKAVNYGRLALGSVLVLAATFGATDAISSRVLKPGFERLRPSHAPALQGQLYHASRVTTSGETELYRGGRYGFVSSHAANTFGLAAAFTLLMGRARWLWAWAAFVTWTRLYLGVHYPTDVLFGAILGIGCAAALRTLHLRIQPAILSLRKSN